VDSKQFVAGLVEEMQRLFADLGEMETLESESGGQMEIITLLKLAMTSELEASELAAHWLPTTPEHDAKLTLAQQVGDEMRHYHLIGLRLEELGEDLSDFDALAEGYTPLYQYQRSLTTTVERIAGGPFASEAIAEVRNQQFIDYCESLGDSETARLYREVIQPEEVHHHKMGREVLEKHATTPELQQLAGEAMRNTLAIADELRTLFEKTTGLPALPVS